MKRATQGWVVASMVAAGCVIFAGGAWAADVTDADRVYRNYTRETATVREGEGRVELRGIQEQNDSNSTFNLAGLRLRSVFPGKSPTDLTGGIMDLVGSYGPFKNTEVGLVIPYFVEQVKFTDGSQQSNEDIGDLQLYGKLQRPVAEHCAVGAGVELSLPNGPVHKGFGTGDLGVNPIVSTRYQKGPLGAGLNVGYQIFDGSAPDVFNYGVEVLVRPGPSWAIRTELSGRVFNQGGKRFDDLQILPGIDYNLTEHLTVRPTGMAGGTTSAMDWGIGCGLAGTF